MRRRSGWLAAVVPLVIGGLFAVPSGSANAQSRPSQASPSSPRVQAPLTPAGARALSKDVTDRVIIVMRDQAPATPDTPSDVGRRDAAVARIQQSVLGELSEVKATNVHTVQLVNAISATVSPGEAARLGANASVAEVVKDEPIPVASPSSDSLVSSAELAAGKLAGKGAPSGSLGNACLPNGQVQLNPEAIEDIHAATQSGTGDAAQALGYTGSGVKVGFIAEGIDINQPDFIRANGQHVFVDYQDFSGTGTNSPTGGGEAFLDASSIAAQGLHTYNVGDAADPCNIRILGVAPGASLVGLDVFGGLNVAFNSVFLEAINYAVNVDHVNVLNESFGSNPFPDVASLDLTRQADDAAVAAGVTVTASSGDAGVTDTIGSPATDPHVISAGASTTYRAYAQAGVGGINYPTVTGYDDDNISGLSSGGVDQSGGTVDVVAPGDLNWALCSTAPIYLDCGGEPFELTGGTSEAAPLTAGTAALVIQAYKESHGGALPTPAIVKHIIVSTAADIDAPADQQGAGLLDAYQAVRAAASYPGATSKATSGVLLDGTTQFNEVGAERASKTLSETVTNTGPKPVTIHLSSRTLGTYRRVATTTAKLTDATQNVAVVKFKVPAGQARLDGSVAYHAPQPSQGDFSAAVNLSLIAPNGHLAEYNLPQGAGNYADAQVAQPAAGTWTALISGEPSADGGTTGPVKFAARVARWKTFGKLSKPSISLPSGATGTFRLNVAEPATPGDEAGSIVLTDKAATPAFTAVTTVPVTLRALAPTPSPTTTFTGTLTGGNGRQASTGVSAFYQVRIPTGTKELSAQLVTNNPANTFLAELVDPVTHQAASTATNNLESESVTGKTRVVPEQGTQLHVLHPRSGLWTLDLNFFNQVSGAAINQTFTVTFTDVAASVKDIGLPDSVATKLTPGKAVTFHVKVTNTGKTREAYFVDGRLNTATTLKLSSLTASKVTVPIPGEAVPTYLVPTHTTSIHASASAPAPIFFDYSYVFGDPDLISSSAPSPDSASGTFNSPEVTAGQWEITPFQDGPDGADGVPPVTAQTAMTATTEAFDPAVSAPSGDLWQASIHPGKGFVPYVVEPGQSVTIPVTFTPHGRPGSKIKGTLFVGDATAISGAFTDEATDNLVPEGSDLAAISYEYTVK